MYVFIPALAKVCWADGGAAVRENIWLSSGTIGPRGRMQIGRWWRGLRTIGETHHPSIPLRISDIMYHSKKHIQKDTQKCIYLFIKYVNVKSRAVEVALTKTYFTGIFF